MVDLKILDLTQVFVLDSNDGFVIADTATTNKYIVIDDFFRRTNATSTLFMDANHTTAADGNPIGSVDFQDTTTVAPAQQLFGQIQVNVQDPANATFEGEMFLRVAQGASSTDYISLNNAGGDDITMHKPIDMTSQNISGLPGTFISALSTVTAASGDFFIISDTGDAGNLKKVDLDDFGGDVSSVSTVLDRQVAIFDGTTGKLIDEGGQPGFPGPTIDTAGRMTIDRGISFTTNGILQAADEQIWAATNRLNVNATSSFGIWIADTLAYEFFATNLNTQNNNIILGTGLLQFGTSETISMQTNDMIFDVTISDIFRFDINSVAALTVSQSALTLGANSNLGMADASQIEWAGSGDRAIYNDTGGFDFLVETGDTYTFNFNSVTEYTFNATEILGAVNNNIVLTGTGFVQMDEQAGDPAAGTTSGKYYVKQVGGIARPFFIGDGLAATDLSAGGGEVFTWTADHDAAGNDLLNPKKIDFQAGTFVTDPTGMYIDADSVSADILRFNVPTNAVIRWTINEVTRMQLGATLSLGGNTDITSVQSITMNETLTLTDQVGGSGYIVMNAFASPGNSGVADRGRIFLDSGNSNHISIIRNDSIVVDLEGGGGEFTSAWTANHNQGGSTFSLEDARFADPTDDTKTIQMSLAGMTTAIELTIATSQSTAQTLTIPNITGAADILVTGLAQTITQPSITTFVNSQHDHAVAASGGQLLSTTALSDTASIAYLNTANTFIAGNKNTFAHSATTAGLGVLPITGTPSGQANGDIWLNDSTNQLFARINGADVDLGAGAGGEIFTWTNDHNTGGFSLLFTNDATPPAGTVPALYMEGSNIQQNVATGQSHRLLVNDAIKQIVTSSAHDFRSQNIEWNSSGFGHSFNVLTTAMDINVGATTDVLSFQTGAVDRFIINGAIDIQATQTFNVTTGTVQEGGVNISPIGLHDIYLDAGAFIPVDAGALTTRIVDTVADQKAFAYIPFAPSVLTFATAKLVLPRTYGLGTMTVILEWTSETEGAGTVEWDISAVAFSEGQDMGATSYGTAQNADDTQTTLNFLQTTSRTSAITIGNTPVDADLIYIKVARNGVGDTFPNEAQLLGMWVEITTDAAVSS